MVIILSWGQCMEAGPGVLILGAEAADEQHLQGPQDMLTAGIKRLGVHEYLRVTWQRPVQPLDTAQVQRNDH